MLKTLRNYRQTGNPGYTGAPSPMIGPTYGFRLIPTKNMNASGAGATDLAGTFPVMVDVFDKAGQSKIGEFLVADSSWQEFREPVRIRLQPSIFPVANIDIYRGGVPCVLWWSVVYGDALLERSFPLAPQDLRTGLIYDSGTVAAGAVIQAPLLSFQGLAQVLLLVGNQGAVGRDLTCQLMADDGSTLDTQVFFTCPATHVSHVSFGHGALATGLVDAAVPMCLPPWAYFYLGAAGVGGASLRIFGR